MATNVGKTLIVNLAISKTKAGMMDTGVSYTTGIDDSVFADFTTGTNNTIKRAALHYEPTLLRCLKEIRPDFAKRFADLGNEITINKEYVDWAYLFELPSDFLQLIRQTNEADKSVKYDCDILDFTEYAHTITGSDDEIYICTTAHTSVDDSDDGEPPDDDGSGNWTIDEDSEWNGAEWEESKAYTDDTDGQLFVTNTLSNGDVDSAYIEYIPYVRAGINDDATKFSPHFQDALATLLAAELELDFERRAKLLLEYKVFAKAAARAVDESDEYEEKVTKVIDARSNLKVG